MADTDFYACTAENPGALYGHPGLLGPGAGPGIGPVLGMGTDVAATTFDIGGSYPADPGAASRYLIAKLKYDTEMTPDERLNTLVQLRQALRDAEQSFSKTEFGKLYKEAQSVPGLGGDVLNGLYAPTNIGSTLATATGAALSAAQKAPTSDLLDIPEDVRQKLLAWARKSGNQGIKSARKRFGDVLKLTRVDGKWMFEIPAGKKAAGYVLRNRAAQNVVRIPAYRQAALEALEARNRLNIDGFGETVGGHITGVSAGGLLALGPQAIFDAIDADNLHQFMSLEAHSQPANAAGWLAGWGAGAYVPGIIVATLGLPAELPALAVLAIGFGVGLGVQVLVSHYAGKRIGNAWDRFMAEHHW
ncbi:hypothetical protein WJ542_28835 [Paraburkholderia sp. B3]|uniref:hypothetical protein n=1 Tax=Paraburkholderia sp. B3 TaxID=3134791 RepID=UPI003981DFF4